MSDWLTSIFLVFFGVWFLACVVGQCDFPPVRKYAQRVRALDKIGMIPSWSFFAPAPGVHDIHLLYRDRRRDGTYDRLQLVPTIKQRRAFDGVWNPEKYLNKIVADSWMSLAFLQEEYQTKSRNLQLLCVSPPYLVLLHLVSREPVGECVVARQFVLAQSKGNLSGDDLDVLFTARFHRVEGSVSHNR